MRSGLCAVAVSLLVAGPAVAEPALEQGFDGALRGCETWVLNPKTWASGLSPFIAAVGLGNAMGLVPRVAEANLPPPPLRVANHYWRINSTPDSGYVLVVSDRLPICHITGGGKVDLQPTVKAVLGGASFNARWEKVDEATKGEMVSTTFRSRVEPGFSLIVSRAASSGQPLDRVQVLATAMFMTSR